MCKLNKYGITRIDPCMRNIVHFIDSKLERGEKILMCCCGHGKYSPSIVVQVRNKSGYGYFYTEFELFSGYTFEKKKRYYKRDKQGYYYIPEVVEYEKNKKRKSCVN